MAEAVAVRPESFVPKARWAMDWYYPVLTGAVVGAAATGRMTGAMVGAGGRGAGSPLRGRQGVGHCGRDGRVRHGRGPGRPGQRRPMICWPGPGTCEPTMAVTGPGAYTRIACGSRLARRARTRRRRSSSPTTSSTGGPRRRPCSRGPRSRVPRPRVLRPQGSGYEAGSPSTSPAASSSLAARRPEPMHAGTPTPL